MNRTQSALLLLVLLTLPLFYLFTPGRDAAPVSTLAGVTMSDFSGGRFRLSTLMTGGKRLLLAFWSITCGDCVAEIPFLIRLHEKFGARLTIIGVHPPSYPQKRIQAFLKRFPQRIPYLLAIDDELQLTRSYEAVVQPKVVLLDERGRVLWAHVGYKEEQDAQMEQEILSHL